MLNYAVGLLHDGPAAGPEESKAWSDYIDNVLCSTGPGSWEAFLHGEERQIHAMRDGLLIITHRPVKLFRKPPRAEVTSCGWPQITSIDLRADPVRINASGFTETIHGISKEKRGSFFNRLTEYRLRGWIPAHVIVEGKPGRAGKMSAVFETVLGGLFLLGIAWAAGWIHGAPAASCKVASVSVNPDVFIVNEKPDAGYTVVATVSNAGGQGAIMVNARLETSEGQFAREGSYTFDQHTTRALSFGFPEPTIDATNIHAWVPCSPGAP